MRIFILTLLLSLAGHATPSLERVESLRLEMLGGDCGAMAHLHMPKTSGSTFNVEAAYRYERVCGGKGTTSYAPPLRRNESDDVKKYFAKMHSDLLMPISLDCDLFSYEYSWGK